MTERRARARRSTSALLALISAAALSAVGAAPAAADPFIPHNCKQVLTGEDERLNRYAGGNRYQTAVCASYWTWDRWDAEAPATKARAVVIASGEAFPDALAAGPLAASAHGPLLLNPASSLLPEVRTEIERVLGPGGTVHLVGGTGALSAQVAAGLTGYTVKRYAGADRYDTAVKIAETLRGDEVMVTTGTDFPDALSAGAAATRFTYYAMNDSNVVNAGMPLVFSQGSRLPARTAAYLDRWVAGKGDGDVKISATGGPAVRAVFDSRFGEHLHHAMSGPDRYATAVEVAVFMHHTAENQPMGRGVGLASGTNFPDGLAATAALMHTGRPLLLTTPERLARPTKDYLTRHAAMTDVTIDVFGGVGAVAEVTAMDALITFMQ